MSNDSQWAKASQTQLNWQLKIEAAQTHTHMLCNDGGVKKLNVINSSEFARYAFILDSYPRFFYSQQIISQINVNFRKSTNLYIGRVLSAGIPHSFNVIASIRIHYPNEKLQFGNRLNNYRDHVRVFCAAKNSTK